MRIKTLGIENYKSFLERQQFQFEPGFNLLLGANNAGKTTVFGAMTFAQPNAPHASIRNLKSIGQRNTAQSKFEWSFSLTWEDLLAASSNEQILLPLKHTALARFRSSGPGHARREFPLTATLNVVLSKQDANAPSVSYESDDVSTGGMTQQGGGHVDGIRVTRDSSGVLQYSGASISGGSLVEQAQFLGSRIFKFAANRQPNPHSSPGQSTVLDSTATNLAYCINALQTGDSDVHRELCELVHRVLPSVAWVHAPMEDGTQTFRLKCSAYKPSVRRPDLAVALDQMGSGVGQVIAILFVALTSRLPSVICIDEPNQFLHPRALRELMQILSVEGSRHQFIVSAHSADMLTAVRAGSIHLLARRDDATVVEGFKDQELSRLRDDLSELGIRLTELHGRDAVFWVEGQTEERVFPDLLRHFVPRHAAGTVVLRVHDTGAFDKKGVDPVKVTQIHARLTTSSALVPPLVCVLLDTEARKQAECKRLQRESAGQLRFLPRRMLENYVLSTAALQQCLAQIGEEHQETALAAAMARAAGIASLDELDIEKVDGAKVLKAVFDDITEARVEFRKTHHVPMLISWLLAHEPDFLFPLGQWLKEAFDSYDAKVAKENS